MKKYEKPRLIALSLEGNERLCGDCESGLTLWNNEENIKTLLEQGRLGYFIGDEDGILEKNDFNNLFDDNSCGELISNYVKGYCKFNGQGMTVIAWS